MASADSPKKSRWSMFKKRERSNSQLPTISNNNDQRLSSNEQPRYASPQYNQSASLQNSSLQNNQYDSAYASSEPPSLHNEPNIVNVENHGRFNNVSADRNLALNKSTGDVLDKDTGEVVSTVTTTTTTTTTTHVKKGKNGETIVEVQTQPAGQASSESRPYTLPTDLVEAPGDSAQPHPRNDNAQVQQAPPEQHVSPQIPHRSPHRSSRELDSIQSQPPPLHSSASGYNFSHPARGELRQSGEWQQPTQQTVPPTRQPTRQPTTGAQPSSRSTFESLRSLAKEQTSPETYADIKAAARGLRGVGELLRGALDGELDTRFPGDEETTVAGNGKNHSTLEHGRNETHMGRINENRDSWNSAGGPALVPGYSARTVSPIDPQASQWQENRSSSRSSSQRRGFRKLIKKKKST